MPSQGEGDPCVLLLLLQVPTWPGTRQLFWALCPGTLLWYLHGDQECTWGGTRSRLALGVPQAPVLCMQVRRQGSPHCWLSLPVPARSTACSALPSLVLSSQGQGTISSYLLFLTVPYAFILKLPFPSVV